MLANQSFLSFPFSLAHHTDDNHIRLTPEEARKLPRATQHVPLAGYEDEYLVYCGSWPSTTCTASRPCAGPCTRNATARPSLTPTGRVNYERWHHVDHCLELAARRPRVQGRHHAHDVLRGCPDS